MPPPDDQAARPDPDALLAAVSDSEPAAAPTGTGGRGRLKVFLGMAPGVGKTYAMVEEARRRASEGLDVLVGYAEPHIRPETEALLLGLDLLPHRVVDHRGVKLKEFDLDAALARRPALCCVDELAHSNAPGSRHEKRWQDVDELLAAGISVYTTLNVQHLESLVDVVQRITGVAVRETLPDAVLDRADEIELVDVSPEELLERLREGKIYRPEVAARATKQFFNAGNLLALRELALRAVAQRVDAKMTEARRRRGSSEPWQATERVLVCVGPAPTSARLVRAAKRLAVSLRADLVAAHVEAPGAPLPENERRRLERHLRLAEGLGARVATLSGADLAGAVLAYAREHNVTKIVVGKPGPRRAWLARLRPSAVDRLIERSGPVDVYAIQGERDAPVDDAPDPGPRPAGPGVEWPGLAAAVAATCAVTAVGWPLYHRLGVANPNVLMLYLLGVVAVAVRCSRGAAVAASVLAVAAFDLVFVPPYYTFAVSDKQYLLTFAVMLLTAVTISTLTHRVRAQADAARGRERQASAQAALARDLVAARTPEQIAAAAIRHASAAVGSPASVLAPRDGALVTLVGEAPAGDRDAGVARWAFDHAKPAGRSTQTLPGAALYLPLVAPRGTVGVLAVAAPADHLTAAARGLLDALAGQAAVALERAALEAEARAAWERVESEFLRNTLLSGVSHELRTPLAAIAGAASTLRSSGAALSPGTRDGLLDTVADEAARMNRLVANLLDMTRLESGGLRLNREWLPIADLVGPALRQLEARLAGRPVAVSLPSDLPLVHADPAALERALVNLLDNAAEYTPTGSPVDLAATAAPDGSVVLTLADRGPGVPSGTESRVFDRFFRASPVSHDGGHPRGVGLGLAIARAVVAAHGGTLSVRNRPPPDTGAVFTLTLPAPATPPPAVPPEEDA